MYDDDNAKLRRNIHYWINLDNRNTLNMRASQTSGLVLSLLSGVTAKSIYVSTTGNGSGTLESPYGSIQTAVNAAVAGDTIFLRGGTYAPSANIQVGKSGTSTAPISVRPYQSEKVVIDGDNMPG